MLLIPKELQGTKAIPFMECVKFSLGSVIASIGAEITQWKNLNEYNKELKDFYSQPFTPEMLTEYFEGLYKFDYSGVIRYKNNIPTYDQYLFDNQNGDIRIYSKDIGHFEIDNTENIPTKTGYPFTLNDLITLCNLAGVELTWKGKLK